MTAPGCADPQRCPVPSPDEFDLRRLTSVVLPAGTSLRRGHKRRYPADEPVPGQDELPDATQMTRFAPVIGRPHVYVARREVAALLESALHEVTPSEPRIRWRQLNAWSLSHVTLAQSVRLIDLRDGALAALGIARHQLVSTDPGHYPCTRLWADTLCGRHVGGRPTVGLLWHSRQAEIHAEQGIRPLIADVLVGEQAEVAVLWPPSGGLGLQAIGPTWELHSGYGLELVRDLANLLGAPPPLTGPGSH
jgi:hypothetical protein